jgi:hypothetical protein
MNMAEVYAMRMPPRQARAIQLSGSTKYERTGGTDDGFNALRHPASRTRRPDRVS